MSYYRAIESQDTRGVDYIKAQPNPNGSELYEGKVVCSEFVIPGSDAPALLDPVEEALRSRTATTATISRHADAFFSVPPRTWHLEYKNSGGSSRHRTPCPVGFNVSWPAWVQSLRAKTVPDY